MTALTHAALVERVARALCKDGLERSNITAATLAEVVDRRWRSWETPARVALAAVAEAAGGAEVLFEGVDTLTPHDDIEHDTQGQANDRRCAALLRALAEAAE